jgi:hypothetical protein
VPEHNENVDAFFNAKIKTDDDLLARLSQKAAKKPAAQRHFFCYTCARHTAAKTSERNEHAGGTTLLLWVLWAYAEASGTFLRH